MAWRKSELSRREALGEEGGGGAGRFVFEHGEKQRRV